MVDTRAGLIVGGAVMLILAVLCLPFFWTGVCLILALLFGVLGLVMILYGLVASGQSVVYEHHYHNTEPGRFCSNCGVEVSTMQNFCDECGSELSSEPRREKR